MVEKARFSETVVKTLFAQSRNVCFYKGCESVLTKPEWKRVNAEITHIRGERPGSARYDASMTEAERQAFENLMLLCPNHHKLIDQLEPDSPDHTVAALTKMKADHEGRAVVAGEWADDSTLTRVALLLMMAPVEGDLQFDSGPPPPRLVISRKGDEIIVENRGGSSARSIGIRPDTAESAQALALAGIPPPELPADGQWKAGIYAPTFGNASGHSVTVSWSSEDGRPFDSSFPLG